MIWRDGASTILGALEYNSYVTGLNQDDVIVGWGQKTSGLTLVRSFLWDGTMRDLDLDPRGIDDAGRMVGYSGGAVFRSGDTSVPMNCGPGGMNNLGQVAGSFSVETPEAGIHNYMCLWDNGVFHDLGVELDQGTATAINDQGVIVGVFDYGFSPSAFVWRSGVVTDLAGSGGFPLAINEAGVVVGWGPAANRDKLAPVVWKDGTVVTLADFGEARDINDSGQIVGLVTTDAGNDPPTGVLWTPP